MCFVIYAINMNLKRCYDFGLAFFHPILRISGVIIIWVPDVSLFAATPFAIHFTNQYSSNGV